MQNIKEFYILGCDDNPIDTPLGQCFFIKVKDYHKFIMYAEYLKIEKYEIVQKIVEKLGQDIKSFIENLSMIEIIHEFKERYEFYTIYKMIFFMCFKEDVFDKIQTDEEFESYRELIRDMNCIRHEKKNPNPEIQKWLDKNKELNNENNVSFKNIVTSVAVYKGLDYKIINEQTVYQLFEDFYQVAKFIGYKTSTLFATVSTEKNKIESWCSSNEENEHRGVLREEFNSLTGSLFGGG